MCNYFLTWTILEARPGIREKISFVFWKNWRQENLFWHFLIFIEALKQDPYCQEALHYLTKHQMLSAEQEQSLLDRYRLRLQNEKLSSFFDHFWVYLLYFLPQKFCSNPLFFQNSRLKSPFLHRNQISLDQNHLRSLKFGGFGPALELESAINVIF